jgi:hypothetical protein
VQEQKASEISTEEDWLQEVTKWCAKVGGLLLNSGFIAELLKRFFKKTFENE